MTRTGKKCGTGAKAGNGIGPPRARPARRGARSQNLLQRLILNVGQTLLGVLPRSRRMHAANDPEA